MMISVRSTGRQGQAARSDDHSVLAHVAGARGAGSVPVAEGVADRSSSVSPDGVDGGPGGVAGGRSSVFSPTTTSATRSSPLPSTPRWP